MRTHRAAALVMAGALTLGGLAACGDDGKDGSGSKTSSMVLSAKEVGGTSVADTQSYLGTISTCGPDSTNLVGGQNSHNSAAYRRSDGSAKDVVIVSVSQRPTGMVDTGLAEVKRSLLPGKCKTEPPTTVRALTGQPSGVVAFGGRFTDDKKQPASIIRTYYYLRPSKTLIMVSLMRTGGGDPSTEVLYKLTNQQISKVRGDAS